MKLESVDFEKRIRRIAGTKENPVRGVTIPCWAIEQSRFDQGEKVKIIVEKLGKTDEKEE